MALKAQSHEALYYGAPHHQLVCNGRRTVAEERSNCCSVALLMLQPKRAEEGQCMLGGRLYQRPERLTCQTNFEHQHIAAEGAPRGKGQRAPTSGINANSGRGNLISVYSGSGLRSCLWQYW